MRLFVSSLSSNVSTPPTGLDRYVSASGNDSANGSISSPWRSLSKVESESISFDAGTTVYFNGGDEFIGTLDLKNSANGTAENQITFTSYGSGKAIIRNDKSITGFSNIGGNIWEADTLGDEIIFVLKNKQFSNICRFPKYVSDTSFSNNFATYTAYDVTETIITVPDFIGLSDLTGCTFICQNRKFVWEQRKITAFNSSTGDVTIESPFYYSFFQADLSCFVIGSEQNLTSQDEWFYDSVNGKLRIYSTTQPTNISVITEENEGIDYSGKEYYKFANLELSAHSRNGFYSEGTDVEVDIDNCDISYCGHRGSVSKEFSLDGTFTNNTVTSCVMGGANMRNVTTMNRNTVSDISRVKYATGSDSTNGPFESSQLSGFGLQARGSDSTMYLNRVTDVGYIGIRGEEGATHIYHNFTQNCGMELDDGGDYYTYNRNRVPSNLGSVWENNIAVAYPNYPNDWIWIGLYLDELSENVIVRNNTTTEGFYRDVYQNQPGNNGNTLTNNNFYKGTVQTMFMSAGKSTLINQNKIIKDGSQDMLYFSSITNYPTGLGTLDNNRYFHTSNVPVNYIAGSGVASGRRSLADWQAYTGQDLNSTDSTGKTITNSVCYYNDSETPISQPISGTWYDLDLNSYTGTVPLGVFEGVILIQYT